MRLTKKKALVTGASRGIGKAIALQLAKEGCTVGVHYLHNQTEAQAVADQVVALGSEAYVFQADLADPAQAIRLGNEAWETMQAFDFLINNAGLSYKKHFLDTRETDVDDFMNVNYKGPFFLTQTVARHLISRGTGGSIYSITSVNGVRPNYGQAAYGASKSALETLMQAVALELAPHGINVNTFAVGAIETDMTAEARANPSFFKEVIDGIPAARFGLPEEIAAVVVDLLSSGTYLTGASLVIDGGMLLMRGYGKGSPYKSR
ncbi:3-oxoacyl-[acyl-carrier-protein] reductase [Rhabdobacter roseus]|uniref:NAD(P)-dependent dehydrogenase (Short-subunit alcohol dehydrogenase family) n=1 Tax=Rhabdobacter roseus TaxID=1655419 RepID=A0A840TSB8_9BACT|nr:SDR family NAD(P)-dependent oxidoreductase [Rhabdobacter roseus]MBB5282599.1 NAD(P)-dependent dehydrogenase (short-subunit alcohol dehydrogenase family) [Rhabdobacter roseus]